MPTHIGFKPRARQVPILDVVKYYTEVDLIQRGRTFWGLCPLHKEKTPSFEVNIEKNFFYCYGCGAGGSGVDFIMKLRGLSFKEAATMIEHDFDIGRKVDFVAKTPAEVRYKREKALAQKIATTFEFVHKARSAIQSELKRRGNKIPARMVEDLGRLEIVESELVSEPERIATGLKLARRWWL